MSTKSFEPTPRPVSTPPTEEQRLTAFETRLNDGFPASYNAIVKGLNNSLKAFWFLHEKSDTRASFEEMQKRFVKLGAKLKARFAHHGLIVAGVLQVAQDNGINPLTGQILMGDVLEKRFEPLLLPTFAWTDEADDTKTVRNEAYSI